MLKKIIIFGLLLWGAIIFYRKFMASTMEPFFGSNKGNVDFMQRKVREYNVTNP